MKANDKQVAGNHYKSAIEPWDAIEAWGLGYLDGSAVKYLARWRKKNGVEDIMKAIHFLEKLVETENDRLQHSHDKVGTDNQGDAQATSEEQVQGSPRKIFRAYSRGEIAFPSHLDYLPKSLGDIT